MRNVFFITLLLLVSCTSKKATDNENSDIVAVEKKNKVNYKNFDERIKFEVREKLALSSEEKFTFEVFYEHLNSDEKKDAIITVNRLEEAMNSAVKSKNPAKLAEIGYMGEYNFFFFYDGEKDEISVPIVVRSSAKTPLKVYFDNIQSESVKDIIIEYRINNAAFRNYYFMQGNDLQLVFMWKAFDKIGTSDYKASTFSYGEGTFCLVNDILIHKGKIKNYTTNIDDLFKYEPEIEATEELEYRFMFDPAKQKYVTNAKPKNEL